MAYALEIQDVHKVFNRGTINEKVALNGVNLNLNPGDFVTIIGGNGAGKSTTLNAIAGVWPIDSGKIIIDGTDITNLPEHKRAKYLGRVFQDPMTGTAATMDIEENMAIALRRGEKRTLRWGVSREDRELFREKLQTLGLGLEDRMTSKVGLLSGGQRQAITLLMAALKQPKLLLLDEHTAALDPKTAAKDQRQDHRRESADRHDGNSQHEGCHRSRQSPDHDARRQSDLRCGWGREEESSGEGSAGKVRGSQRRRIRQ